MKYILIICYLLLFLYMVEQYKLNKKIESFNINFNNENIRPRIDFLLSVAKGDNINCKLLNITNNLNVNGHLTVKKGSSFNGDRHFFKDEKNVGKLRVGAAWNIPGIYSEDNKDLSIYASSNQFTNVHINNNLYVTSNFIPSVKH